MEEGFYRQTAAVEGTHWYMVARRELVRAWLRRMGFAGTRALEVGCGSGGNLPLLGEFCAEVTGMDLSEVALRFGARTSARMVRADANLLPAPFEARSFDLVADFNVLYHRWIIDDAATVRGMASLLRPGGVLVLFEPAFMHLWRRHDERDMGRRRFRAERLETMLRASGLEIVARSYFNLWAYLPALLLARVERLAPARGDGTVAELALPPRALNAAILGWMRIENRCIRAGARLPRGTTVFCIARAR
jgi:SAM-dependent methyltransferase